MRRRFNVMDVVWTSKRRRVLTGLLTNMKNYLAIQLLSLLVLSIYYNLSSLLVSDQETQIMHRLQDTILEYSETLHQVINLSAELDW